MIAGLGMWVARHPIQPAGDGPARGWVTDRSRRWAVRGNPAGLVQPWSPRARVLQATGRREGERAAWTRPASASSRSTSARAATPCGAPRSCSAATGTAPTTTPRPRSSPCTGTGAGSATATRSTPGCGARWCAPSSTSRGGRGGGSGPRPSTAGTASARRRAADAVATRHVLVDGLRAVPPRQRAVLVLRYLEGLDVAGTAAALGCTRGHREEPDRARAGGAARRARRRARRPATGRLREVGDR